MTTGPIVMTVFGHTFTVKLTGGSVVRLILATYDEILLVVIKYV